MDDGQMIKTFLECDDLLILGVNNNRLLLWHREDTDEMKVLDMLLNAYHNFYKLADEKPLH